MMNRLVSVISLIILICGFCLSGCARRTPGGQPTPAATPAGESAQPTTTAAASLSAPASAQTSTAAGQKTFTAAELAKYDGKNGSPAYIAVDGVVYDVTSAPAWSNGKHQWYQAGRDLSKDIRESQHGTWVLDQLPVVGKYTG